MSETVQRAKLPLWRTVRESYVLGFGHLVEVASNAWTVLAALFFLSFVLYWLAHPYIAGPGLSTGQWITVIIVPLPTIVFGAMVAVPWHRLILDNVPLPPISLSASPSFISYIGWGILFSAPFYVAVIALSLLSEPPLGTSDDTFELGPFAIAAIVFLGACYILVRFGIKLPAVALDDKSATVQEILRVTSWNFWRLLWGALITLLPVLAFSLGLIAFFPDEGSSRWVYALANALDACAEVVLGMISLTFLSLAYRHFFRD